MLSNIDTNRNAADLIDRHISDNAGDQLALRYGEKRYSYHDLAALMNRAGNMFRRFGVGVGDEILIAVAPSPSLLACLLGAIKIGAAAILLSKIAEKSAVTKIVSERNPKLVVCDAARVPVFEGQATLPLVVVGTADASLRSFLNEMRESASSLARSSIAMNAPALAVANGHEFQWLKHEDIVAADSHSLILDGWSVGDALSRFSRGDEVQIG